METKWAKLDREIQIVANNLFDTTVQTRELRDQLGELPEMVRELVGKTFAGEEARIDEKQRQLLRLLNLAVERGILTPAQINEALCPA